MGARHDAPVLDDDRAHGDRLLVEGALGFATSFLIQNQFSKLLGDMLFLFLPSRKGTYRGTARVTFRESHDPLGIHFIVQPVSL